MAVSAVFEILRKSRWMGDPFMKARKVSLKMKMSRVAEESDLPGGWASMCFFNNLKYIVWIPWDLESR